MNEMNKKANKITAAGVLQMIGGTFLIVILGAIELVIRLAAGVTALASGALLPAGCGAVAAIPPLFIIGLFAGSLLILRGYMNYTLAGRFRKVAKTIGDSTHISFINLERRLSWKRPKLLKTLKKQQRAGFWPGSYIDMTGESFVLDYNPVTVKAGSGDAALDEVLTGANAVIAEIAKAARQITDTGLKAQAEKLAGIAGQIYTFVAENPGKAGLVRRLTNYFLPTTATLLNKYIELQNQTVKTETMAEAMGKIGEVMATLEDVYKNQLDALHGENVMNVDVEIEVLQNMAEM